MKTNNAFSNHAGRFTTAWTTKLLPLLLLLTLPAVVQAQSYTDSYGTWYYATTNDSITITNYSGPGGDVTIPNRINGLPVTSIGDFAFSGVSSLTSVTIPNSVTSIGYRAFEDCTSLTSVAIPNSVTNIGNGAFQYSTNLSSITIPNSVTSIGFDLFYYCTGLTSVTIPNSVTSIGGDAFIRCSLTSVTIPNSVTNIGGDAFGACDGLTSVTIPNSGTSLGDFAFWDCGSLTNVTIGTNVTSIGDFAFSGVSSLTSVTIPNSVTSIGDSVFSGCGSLTSVTIPNSVTSLGDFAFSDCGSLTNVTIPNSVTSIGVGAFSYCFGLTAITVDTRNAVYSDVDGVLFNQSLTTLVEYPRGIAGSYTIPNSVTNIGEDAFFYSPGLTSVTTPSGVTSIGDSAFSWCTSLTSVYFQGNAPSFGVFLFCAFDLGDKVCDPATIYYLPGTTGWSTNFAEVWQPQVLTTDGTFGVRTNRFGFTINWASGMTVVVEASTNLANPTWIPLATNTLTGASAYFSDPQWTNYATRFYRLRWP